MCHVCKKWSEGVIRAWLDGGYRWLCAGCARRIEIRWKGVYDNDYRIADG